MRFDGFRNFYQRERLKLELGQGRDGFGPFGEDRIKIPKPPWRAPDREETATSGSDPSETDALIRHQCSPETI
jgi:hypothetical protein